MICVLVTPEEDSSTVQLKVGVGLHPVGPMVGYYRFSGEAGIFRVFVTETLAVANEATQGVVNVTIKLIY